MEKILINKRIQLLTKLFIGTQINLLIYNAVFNKVNNHFKYLAQIYLLYKIKIIFLILIIHKINKICKIKSYPNYKEYKK